MLVDLRNRLWIPAAQLHLAAAFKKGTNLIKKPIEIFTPDIGVGRSPMGHIQVWYLAYKIQAEIIRLSNCYVAKN